MSKVEIPKINLLVLAGGKSSEHEVSLHSAKNIVTALNKEKYSINIIGISKSGTWYLMDEIDWLNNENDPKTISLKIDPQNQILLNPSSDKLEKKFYLENGLSSLGPIDVIFPILHGQNGEDGTMQGLLKLLGIPFIGPNTLGSSSAMDKEVTKILANAGGVLTPKYLAFKSSEKNLINPSEIIHSLGLPLFVKPANCGSSVGISKVTKLEDLESAITHAFSYDLKILIEEGVIGKEIECSVLGNETPEASLPGEVLPTHEFYSYDAKYVDADGARFKIPADLPQNKIKEVQEIAIKVFKLLNCEGLARVDFFIDLQDRVLLNEINTIPGFTKISMYPKMWSVSGLEYGALLDRLIELAKLRFERDSQLKS